MNDIDLTYSIPADMKSSRSENGTNVANRVMITPANSAPFLGSPFESTSLNILGKSPSLASANCKRGCIISDTNTTIGRVMTSPACKVFEFHFDMIS